MVDDLKEIKEAIRNNDIKMANKFVEMDKKFYDLLISNLEFKQKL